jgi:hypothetical protein
MNYLTCVCIVIICSSTSVAALQCASSSVNSTVTTCASGNQTLDQCSSQMLGELVQTASCTTHASVLLYPTDSINMVAYISAADLPRKPIDVYFLWDVSARARNMSHAFWQTGPRRLYATLLSMRILNPALFAGLGFFTTKRLSGMGINPDFVFRPVVPVTANIISIDSNMITEHWTNDPPNQTHSNVTAGLEALMHVILNSESLGFRPGSRRVIILATASFPGVETDVAKRVIFNGTQQPENVPYPRPNDYDETLEADCFVADALVCPDECALVPQGHPDVVFPPNVVCACPKELRQLSVSNISQFAAGSCEDFPSVAGVVARISNQNNASVLPFELLAFVPDIVDVSEYSNGQNSRFFQELIDQLGGGGRVINSTLDLASFIETQYPPEPTPPPMTFQPYMSANIVNVTLISCNQTVCAYEFTFAANGDVGNFTASVGNSSVTINILECDPFTNSQSASPTEPPQSNMIDYDDIVVGNTPPEWNLEHVILSLLFLFFLLILLLFCVNCKLPRVGVLEKREIVINKAFRQSKYY